MGRTRRTCNGIENNVRILHRLPKVVLVKFSGRGGKGLPWTLPGCKGPGLYPIVPQKSTWCLDRNRLHPVLRIMRSQLRLAPAFALIAHAAQGQTLKHGAIVGLNLSRGASAMGSYGAFTRMESRKALLINRPFVRDVFTSPIQGGPELLLQHLRGEDIDWEEIENKYMPRARCAHCSFIKFKRDFALQQFNKRDKRPFCRDCVHAYTNGGIPLECVVCNLWKSYVVFLTPQQHHSAINTRTCCDCQIRRVCVACNRNLLEEAFAKSEWHLAQKSRVDGNKRGVCKECSRRSVETQKCSVCNEAKVRSEYSAAWAWESGPSARKCAACTGQKRAGEWTCLKCGHQASKDEFSLWLAFRKAGRKPRTRDAINTCEKSG